MASQYPGNRWTDEQLEAILFGNRRLDRRRAPREGAMRHAQACGGPWNGRRTSRPLGAVVVALCRLPGDNIIVFEGQAERLRKLCAGLEVAVLRETDHRPGSSNRPL